MIVTVLLTLRVCPSLFVLLHLRHIKPAPKLTLVYINDTYTHTHSWVSIVSGLFNYWKCGWRTVTVLAMHISSQDMSMITIDNVRCNTIRRIDFRTTKHIDKQIAVFTRISRNTKLLHYRTGVCNLNAKLRPPKCWWWLLFSSTHVKQCHKGNSPTN